MGLLKTGSILSLLSLSAGAGLPVAILVTGASCSESRGARTSTGAGGSDAGTGGHDTGSGGRDAGAGPHDSGAGGSDAGTGTGDAGAGGDGAADSGLQFCRGCSLTPSDSAALTGGVRPLIGMYYFDGWADESSSNFHVQPLLDPAWSGREPLTGWYDDDPAVIDQFSAWASAAGINYWIFDWYAVAFAGNSSDKTLNTALSSFVASGHKSGLSFALNYVASPSIPASDWSTYCQTWAAMFANDAYLKLDDGRPVFFVLGPGSLDTSFAQTGGGAAAVSQLRAAVASAQLADGGSSPGVYIVGLALPGPNYGWPNLETYMGEGYDAFTQYNYPGGGATTVGAGTKTNPTENPYSALSGTGTAIWDMFLTYQSMYGTATSPHYIPSVTLGWDARPWQETPYYYDRDPASVASFVLQGELWSVQHASQNLSSHTPLVVLEAWNELGEGSYVVPTGGDQGAYLQAIAGVIPP